MVRRFLEGCVSRDLSTARGGHTMAKASMTRSPISFLSCLTDSQDTFPLQWPGGCGPGEAIGTAMPLFISGVQETSLAQHRDKETLGSSVKPAWEGTSSAFRTTTNREMNRC